MPMVLVALVTNEMTSSYSKVRKGQSRVRQRDRLPCEKSMTPPQICLVLSCRDDVSNQELLLVLPTTSGGRLEALHLKLRPSGPTDTEKNHHLISIAG